jgi:putative aminopeptidase FrvX
MMVDLVPHQALRRFVIEVAKEENIPYQEALLLVEELMQVICI